jgi:hypothetical protein
VVKGPLVPPWFKRKYDIASVYQPHSGLLPSHPPKKHQLQHSLADSTPRQMSALLLKLGGCERQGTTTHDGMQVFSCMIS